MLKGDRSRGEFYSIALTSDKMQADTGTKMIHIGNDTSSLIISKGISADASKNSYRGQVRISKNAERAKNFTQCDSMLIGSQSKANTYPVIEVKNNSAKIEHEATTSRISAEQLHYLKTRGLTEEKAISMMVHGFCGDIFKKLPLEFSVEAVKLLEMKLEGTVG